MSSGESVGILEHGGVIPSMLQFYHPVPLRTQTFSKEADLSCIQVTLKVDSGDFSVGPKE